MLKVALRGLRFHPIRFVLTTIAVLGGVAFVVSAVVLTASVRAEFDTLLEEINAGIDLTVRAEERFDQQNFGGTVNPVPEDLLSEVRSVDGVASADGTVQGFPALLVDESGEPVSPPTGGPPLGVNWTTNAELSTVQLERGDGPTEPDEIAIDRDLADRADVEVGDTVQVQTAQGPGEYTLTGVFTFGESNSLGGATIVAFTTPEAQRLFNLEDQFATIEVSIEPEADKATVQQEVASLLPRDIEVVDNEEVVQESQEELGAIFSIFGNVLLGFAGIALFVSAYLIANTFNITVSQRVRELALLRAIGATGRQVATSVMIEAAVVGIVAVILGSIAGVVLSLVFQQVLNQAGFGAGDTSLVLTWWPFVLGLALGLGLSLLLAVHPAWKATTVPPVAAMQEGYRISNVPLWVRLVAGALLTLAGAGMMVNSLFGDPGTTVLLTGMILGAVSIFVGITLLSPVIAGPVARVVGAPFAALLNVTGRLARGNAARNPRRTSTSAAALMIGLALVSMSLVIGASIRATLEDALESSITADWYIDTGSFFPFSPTVVDELREQPELAAVTGGRFGQMQVRGDTRQFNAVDYDTVTELFDLDVQAGEIEPGSQGVLVQSDPATDLGLEPGDTLTVTFQATGDVDLPVLAVYEDSSILGNWIIDQRTYDENFTEQVDFWAAARTAEGIDADEARAAIEGVLADHPELQVQDRSEFQQSQEDQINQALIVVFVFLALAVIIAFIGIMNTQALAVFERTREIGLLRAVGQTRRQVWGMVVIEATIVAVFGALLGVVVGVPFGWAIGVALPEDFISIVSFPWAQLVLLVVLAGILGVVAALYPAWRASRLDVLEAISYE